MKENPRTVLFKIINDLDPSFMKEIFTIKINSRVRPNNIAFKSHNTATYEKICSLN